MELKSKLTIAALICVGLFATGCSQQQAVGSQQTASQQTAAPTPAPTTHAPVKPVKRGGGAVHRPVHRGPVVPPVKVPPVKVKGKYKGAVQMDPAATGAMQQYRR